MTASDVFVTVSGLVGTESAARAASVAVLVAYDTSNDVYVPVACDPKGNLHTSGAI
ncbi:hypothetical protein LCGC14_1997300 [marine sediment metagenome]|uniref:Uncharacterized protein n=1 Tax=marine sediment metagenome TaxID=412755 RepID=A0A0F9FS86_9ZZZZ